MRLRLRGRTRPASSDLTLVPFAQVFTLVVLFLLEGFSPTGEVLCLCTNRPRVPEVASPQLELTLDPVIEVREGGAVVISGAVEPPARIAAALNEVALQLQALRGERPLNVNLVADRSLTVGQLRDALRASIAAGFTRVSFIVSESNELGTP